MSMQAAIEFCFQPETPSARDPEQVEPVVGWNARSLQS